MREATAVIHLQALRHNLQQVRTLAPQSRVYAAIKADGYGHGAVQVAQALESADGFAVASVDEALRLRWSGVTGKPVMLLSMPLTIDILSVCGEHQLQPVVFDPAQLPMLEQYGGPPIPLWVKLDTGMHRLGIDPAQAQAVYAKIEQNPALSLAGWFTHLGCADDVASDFSTRQIECFDAAVSDFPGLRSVANSAGVVAWPDSHKDIVRPGIMLYGGSPLRDKTAAELGLSPAMTLRAPLISVREVAAGEPVGYGATWRAPQATRIGVVAIGYGDGYPRRLSNRAKVLLHGQRLPVVGRVSMDMITIDLEKCPQAAVGDPVVLWGQGLPADEIAQAADTIAYELFCQLTSRVSFQYET